MWPLHDEDFRVTQPFAKPGGYASRADAHGRAGHHTGIDLGDDEDGSQIDGKPVRTIVPGEVVISDYNPTMGNWVGVYDSKTGLLVTYWHLRNRLVMRGQRVTLGHAIGHVGSTGNSTAAHLHLQVNRGRTFDYHGHIDPAVAINAYPEEGTPVATTYGIDVARYQKDLSLRSVVEQGYDFIIIKCTEGQGYVSPTWTAQRDAALRTSALFAAYHWLRSDSTPADQADNIARNIGDKTIPVFIDCEPVKDKVTGRIISWPTLPMCAEFRDECRKRGIRTTALYLPEWYWRQIGRPSLKGWILWQSDYGLNPRGYGSVIYPGNGSDRWASFGGVTPTLLQFGSRGKLDGYPEDVDVNAFRGTREELEALNLFRDPKPAPPPPPPPPPTPTKGVWLTVVSANIGRKGGREGSRVALEEIHDFAPTALVGLQEIGEADRWNEHRMVRRQLSDGHTLVGMGTHVPVLTPAWWDLLSAQVLRATPGIPRISPARVIVEARIQHRGIEVVHLNTHMVAGAWNRKWNAKDWLRKRFWRRHWRILSERAAHWHGLGATVVVTLDGNRSNRLPALAEGEIEHEHGLDAIKVIPAAGHSVEVPRRGFFDLPIEPAHDALWASVHITKE